MNSERREDLVVIGAGIFGCIAARALGRIGMQPLLIDDYRENAGSPPAACLMRPSWFEGIHTGDFDLGLNKLDDLVGVQNLQFSTAVGLVTVHWCEPPKIRTLPRDWILRDTAVHIENSNGFWRVKLKSGDSVLTRILVVAAGAWTGFLVPEIPVETKPGVAWLWPQLRIEQPFIKFWAPFKQVVAFNRGDGLWAGDAQRRLDKPGRVEASLKRCRTFLRGVAPEEVATLAPKRLFGYRPYVAGAKPCYLSEVRRNLWVVTGGAKNGTLAAGWAGAKLAKALGGGS